MKTITILSIVLISLGVIFFIAQKIMAQNSESIEHYNYEVLQEYEEFEIRKYDEALFSYVELNSNKYEQVSSSGFRVLAGYIFGGNQTGEKIAMTSPVAMEMEEEGSTMMFMVPNNYDLDDLPNPNDQRVKFKKEPAKTIAAIQFGGWANEEKIQAHAAKLFEQLDQEGIEHADTYTFLGYNAPFEVINRRNEVIVEVKR